MDMAYWGKFKDEPVFLHEEGGSYFISTSDNPDDERYWLTALINMYNDKPEQEMTYGAWTGQIAEMEELLNEINNFLSAIKTP